MLVIDGAEGEARGDVIKSLTAHLMRPAEASLFLFVFVWTPVLEHRKGARACTRIPVFQHAGASQSFCRQEPQPLISRPLRPLLLNPKPAALEGGVPPHGLAFSLFMVCKLAGSLVYVLLQQRGAPVHTLLNGVLIISAVSLAARCGLASPCPNQSHGASAHSTLWASWASHAASESPLTRARSAPGFVYPRQTQTPIFTKSYASALVSFCLFEAAFGAYWPAMATVRAEILPVREKRYPEKVAWSFAACLCLGLGCWHGAGLMSLYLPRPGLDASDGGLRLPRAAERPRDRRAPPRVLD